MRTTSMWERRAGKTHFMHFDTFRNVAGGVVELLGRRFDEARALVAAFHLDQFFQDIA